MASERALLNLREEIHSVTSRLTFWRRRQAGRLSSGQRAIPVSAFIFSLFFVETLSIFCLCRDDLLCRQTVGVWQFASRRVGSDLSLRVARFFLSTALYILNAFFECMRLALSGVILFAAYHFDACCIICVDCFDVALSRTCQLLYAYPVACSSML